MNEFISSLPRLPQRETSGHKGTYGTAVLIAGSLGMGGAAALAGGAALRSGAGLVRVLVPSPIQTAVSLFRPEYTVFPLPADREGRFARRGLSKILTLASPGKAAGFGPGLGRSKGVDAIVSLIFVSLPMPAVIDADALNSLSCRESFIPPAKRGIFRSVPAVAPAAPRIMTPHPGEFFRMSGIKIGSDTGERRRAAVDFTRSLHKIYGTGPSDFVLVLKGAGTIVTDGEQVFVNETGNPGMGTGGAGDVLTGVITALLAQGMPPYEASVLGVAVHGLAGDIAAQLKGEVSLSAGDILDSLPDAFQRVHVR